MYRSLRPVITVKLIKFVGLKFSSRTSPAWIKKNSEKIIGDHQKLLLYEDFQCLWRFLEASYWRTMRSILLIFEDDIGHWLNTVHIHGNSTKIWSRIWTEVANLNQFATILQTGLRLQLCPWCQWHCSHQTPQNMTTSTDFIELNLYLIQSQLHKHCSNPPK